MAFNTREQLANIPVIANETARMVQAFRSWPQSYWSRPAYCPGWTAADAVAHLTMGGDFYAQVITSGRSGEPTFPWGVNTPAEFREARQAARSLSEKDPRGKKYHKPGCAGEAFAKRTRREY